MKDYSKKINRGGRPKGSKNKLKAQDMVPNFDSTQYARIEDVKRTFKCVKRDLAATIWMMLASLAFGVTALTLTVIFALS